MRWKARVDASARPQKRRPLGLCDIQVLPLESGGTLQKNPSSVPALWKREAPLSLEQRLRGQHFAENLQMFRGIPGKAFLTASPRSRVPGRRGQRLPHLPPGKRCGASPAPGLLFGPAWAAAETTSSLGATGRYPAPPTLAAQLSQLRKAQSPGPLPTSPRLPLSTRLRTQP